MFIYLCDRNLATAVFVTHFSHCKQNATVIFLPSFLITVCALKPNLSHSECLGLPTSIILNYFTNNNISESRNCIQLTEILEKVLRNTEKMAGKQKLKTCAASTKKKTNRRLTAKKSPTLGKCQYWRGRKIDTGPVSVHQCWYTDSGP